MQDPPSAAELLLAVTEFLRDHAMPQLQGRTAFHARVAVNVLEIVRRELELADASDATERASLRRLLALDRDDHSGGKIEHSEHSDVGRDDGEPSLLALNRRLCERIANGEFTLDTPGLIAHLRQVALAKLAVDQPGYAAYRAERADAFHEPDSGA